MSRFLVSFLNPTLQKRGSLNVILSSFIYIMSEKLLLANETKSSLFLIKNNVSQILPLLSKLRFEMKRFIKDPVVYQSIVLKPTIDVMDVVFDVLSPLEKLYHKNDKIDQGFQKIDKNESHFDVILKKFVSSVISVLFDDNVCEQFSLPLIASFMPVYHFFLNCISPSSNIDINEPTFNSIFLPIYNYMNLYKGRFSRFNYTDMEKQLQCILGDLSESQQFDFKDIFDYLPSFIQEIENIKMGSLNVDVLGRVKHSILEFRSLLLKLYPSLSQNRVLLKKISLTKALLGKIESHTTQELDFYASLSVAEELYEYINSTVLAVRIHHIDSDLPISFYVQQSFKLLKISLKALSCDKSIIMHYSKELNDSISFFDCLINQKDRSLIPEISKNVLNLISAIDESHSELFKSLYGSIDSDQIYLNRDEYGVLYNSILNKFSMACSNSEISLNQFLDFSLFEQNLFGQKNSQIRTIIDSAPIWMILSKNLILSRLHFDFDFFVSMFLQSISPSNLELIEVLTRLIQSSRKMRAWGAAHSIYEPSFEIYCQSLEVINYVIRDNSEPLLASALNYFRTMIPSFVLISEILHLPKVLETLNFYMDQLNNGPKAINESMNNMNNKFFERDYYQSLMFSVITIDSTPENPLNLLQAIEQTLSIIEFLKLHIRLTEILSSSNQQNTIIHENIIFSTILRITSSLFSIYESKIVGVSMNEEFVLNWLRVLTEPLYSTKDSTDMISSFIISIPFLDFSDSLRDAIVLNNSMCSLIRSFTKENNDEIDSFISSAEEFRSCFYNGLLACKFDMEKIISLSKNVLDKCKSNYPEWYSYIHKQWMVLSSFTNKVTMLFNFCSDISDLSIKMDLSFKCSSSTVLFLNLVNCISGSILSITETNFFEDRPFERSMFSEFPEKIRQIMEADYYFITKDFDQFRNKISNLFLDIKSSLNSYHTKSLLRMASHFLREVIIFASSPSSRISPSTLDTISKLNQLLSSADVNSTYPLFDIISSFSIIFKSVPFDRLGFSEQLKQEFSSLYELIDATMEYLVLDFQITLTDSMFIQFCPNGEFSFLPLERIGLLSNFEVNSSLCDHTTSTDVIGSLILKLDAFQRFCKENGNERLTKTTKDTINVLKGIVKPLIPSQYTEEQQKKLDKAQKLLIEANEIINCIQKKRENMSFVVAKERVVKCERVNVDIAVQNIEIQCLAGEIEEYKHMLEQSKRNYELLKANGKADHVSIPYCELSRVLNDASHQFENDVGLIDSLSNRFSEISDENDQLFNEYVKKKFNRPLSHEEQMDFLLGKSEELKLIRSSQSIGKEEVELMKHQLKETIDNLKRRIAFLETNDSQNPAKDQMRVFLKKYRDRQYSDAHPNSLIQKKFFDDTIQSAQKLMNERKCVYEELEKLRRSIEQP